MEKIYFYINNLGKGGAERVIIQLADKFQSAGYNVKIITSFKAQDEHVLPQNIIRVNLETRQDFGSRLKRNIKLILKLRRIIKEEQPDILISFMQEPNFRAILSTIGTKVCNIVSVRNDPNKEYAGLIGKIVGRYVLPLADGCVFQTEQAQSWFPTNLQNKSTIIYNEVSENFFLANYNPKKNIVAVGRLSEQKNHKLLIQSFSRIANEFLDRNLYIYGDGVLKKELENLINKLGLHNRVYLMGTSNDIPDILEEAELFVLSSDYEGMPNALLEALAVGVPSISTNCPSGGPELLISQNVNGILVPVGDSLQLSIAMRKILSDDILKQKLSQNAKILAEGYRPSSVFQKWESYINKIIDKVQK